MLKKLLLGFLQSSFGGTFLDCFRNFSRRFSRDSFKLCSGIPSGIHLFWDSFGDPSRDFSRDSSRDSFQDPSGILHKIPTLILSRFLQRFPWNSFRDSFIIFVRIPSKIFAETFLEFSPGIASRIPLRITPTFFQGFLKRNSFGDLLKDLFKEILSDLSRNSTQNSS